MKTVGFNPNKEKYLPVEEVAVISTKLRMRLADKSGKPVPGYLKAVEVDNQIYASCAGCCLTKLTSSYPSCEDAVGCRTTNRRDDTEVRFVFCNESGEPL